MRGLYLITPTTPDTATLLARVAAVLPGAALLQYRAKDLDASLRAAQARALATLCRAGGVPLVVNDDPVLAATVGAGGVHVGATDAGVATAVARLPGGLVGASCYADLALAEAAVAAGAGYVAFGAFHASPTKPAAVRADPALLRQAARLRVPRVAIGGITPENAGELIAAGADMVAVISGVFDAPDPVAAARAYRACFD